MVVTANHEAICINTLPAGAVQIDEGNNASAAVATFRPHKGGRASLLVRRGLQALRMVLS